MMFGMPVRQDTKKSTSISGRVVIAMSVLLISTVLAGWLLNTFFLGTYYEVEKEETICSTYEFIADATRNDKLEDEDFLVNLEQICSRGNLNVVIYAPNGEVVLTSVSSSEELHREFTDAVFSQDTPVLEKSENYEIKKQTDNRLNLDYILLWGVLPDGNLIMIRSALESIRESAAIANRFLFLVGIATVVVGIFIMYFVTRGITKPLTQLTEISKRMAALDFDAKYVGHTSMEVDLLGENMNHMAQSLESSIAELKSANNELMLDNQRKTEVDEMRKEFLSNVSHELKTPLALIQGYAEGLKECINDDEESRDFYCDVIIDETAKMNRMVKKLLSLNQLEFGNDTITMERFDVTELIRGLLNASSLMMKQKEITVEFDDSQSMYVWADEFKLEEVLTNFVSNAINHIDFEKIIKIYYTEKEDCVRISVFNTGKPIPEEDLDKVWIKFYKVDKARTREYGGSGIGLSIVKAIMDSFNRECGVINHENGVEFWCELDTSNTGSHLWNTDDTELH